MSSSSQSSWSSRAWYNSSHIVLKATLLVLAASSLMINPKLYITRKSEIQFSSSNTNKNKDNNGPAANTGTLFSGAKIRSFPGSLRLQDQNTKNTKNVRRSTSTTFPKLAQDCDKWAVVTTINAPTEAVQSVARLPNWCLVIVGDTKTPSDYMTQGKWEGRDDVVFLSAAKQQDEFVSNPFVQRIPFKSFARKNIGFLFAIRHGAKVIYDFDDDNVILEGQAPLGDNLERRQSLLLRYTTNHHNDLPSSAFNPLPYMNATEDNIWPRGFPLKDLALQPSPLEPTQHGSIDFGSVGVIQAVCDEDPDFDAVYRLTRTLPVYFDTSIQAHRLLVPKGMYAPYNAQATTHMYKAFWGLLLPWTVPGRVTDIWRSYFTQRIMHDLNLALVYEPPLVRHDRSPHDYTADMQAENALYMKTSALLEFLSKEWQADTNHLPARIEQLTVDLYERDYFELDDVYGMQEWLLALLDIGYEFPDYLPDTAIEKVALHIAHEPALEEQAYMASPSFNTGKNGRRYADHIKKSGIAGSELLFKEWLKDVKSHRRPSKEAILKLVGMTKNEWPLLKDWILYHGELVGFENLYVLDGSTDPASISFLKYARDNLGANILFSSANLNELQYQLSAVGQEISKASDFVIKMDTDEFLAAYTGDAGCSQSSTTGNENNTNCTLSPYSVKETVNQLREIATGERLKIGYVSTSQPNEKVCNAGKSDDIGAYPVGLAAPIDTYKTISDSRTLVGLDLGGHKNFFAEPFAPKKASGERTNLSILHFHGRCLDNEVNNCRKVLVSHGFISQDDSDEVAKIKLTLDDVRDVENICQLEKSNGMSSHKRLFYLKWLSGCITPKTFYQKVSGRVNLDFQRFLSDAKSKYELETTTVGNQ